LKTTKQTGSSEKGRGPDRRYLLYDVIEEMNVCDFPLAAVYNTRIQHKIIAANVVAYNISVKHTN
jgi:hypothetical protein